MTPAEEYINSIKGKKVAFVGMGVANTPCAEFFAKNGIDHRHGKRRQKRDKLRLQRGKVAGLHLVGMSVDHHVDEFFVERNLLLVGVCRDIIFQNEMQCALAEASDVRVSLARAGVQRAFGFARDRQRRVKIVFGFDERQKIFRAAKTRGVKGDRERFGAVFAH